MKKLAVLMMVLFCCTMVEAENVQAAEQEIQNIFLKNDYIISIDDYYLGINTLEHSDAGKLYSGVFGTVPVER